MQLKICIKNDSEFSLPLSYNYQLMSAVYRMLGGSLAGAVHGGGWRSGKASFRLFTFSPLKGRYRINGKQIVFDSDFAFELRSPVSEIIEAAKNSLTSCGKITLFDRTLQVGVIECCDRRFSEEYHLVQTSSPICVKRTAADGTSVYYSPEDARFYELIELNLRRKFTAAYDREPPSTVSLSLMGAPKKVVTRIKDIWVTAYHASFAMRCHPLVTNFLYDAGVGGRNSQGFGMIDII